MGTRAIMVISLKCIEISNCCIVTINCHSIVGQLYFKEPLTVKFTEREVGFVVPRSGSGGGGVRRR